MSVLILTKAAIRSALSFVAQPRLVIASSTGWFVCNTDTKTVEADPDDPAQYALGSQTKVKVIETLGKTYLDLAHLYVGTDPAAALSVRAFGFFSLDQSNGTTEPYQVSTSYAAVSADHVGGGFWAPLFKAEAGGSHELTFGTTPDVDCNDASPNYKLKGGVTYATQGCERAIVLVSAAVTNPTVGCLLAKTSN